MNPSRKKEILQSYKLQGMQGGVYAIHCTANGKRWIDCATNLVGMENRLSFSIQTNSPPIHQLQKDWEAYGASAFVFEVLETMPQKEEETPQDYRDSLALLRDCHRSEYPADQLYGKQR